ncbi:MAG: YggS family pyridoxal phosphate-dependent enzyme [Alphaproteobacteria bacterium]|nr:YggS family pyridoxal phosphate-dependent enzyme [Alphaproteobacteria bacterium]
MDIIAKYQEIKASLGQGVRLMAVTKNHTAEEIRPLLEAGHRLFGENRVFEAIEKWQPLKEEYPDIELHMIGSLQSNKLKEALGIFSAIDSVDRESLAQKLSLEDIGGKSFLIEVNTGSEPQKGGIMPEEADDFINKCLYEYKLPIKGLMCVPPADEEASPHFAFLKTLAKRHGLKELSMGMSGDYLLAVQQGSTCVRLGTVLFGPRKS